MYLLKNVKSIWPLLLYICYISPAFAQTTCISVDQSTSGSATNTIGQSFTMPLECILGFFHSIEIEKSSIDAYTGTLTIYSGESVNDTDQVYQQTGVSVSGSGFQSIFLEGGSGSLSYTPGGIYTFVFSNYDDDGTSPFAYLYSTTNTYSDGRKYSNEFISPYDLSFKIITTPEDHLPVELINFTAHAFGHTVLLNWSTASEVNNYRFDIERSTLDNPFKTIGWRTGNGSTTQPHSYSFTDYPPFGTSYYRLKQIDYDGNFEYSNVVVAQSSNHQLFYPNPTSGIVKLQSISSKHAIISVYNQYGKMVMKYSGDEVNTINLTKQPDGIYLIKITSTSQNLEQLVIKE